MRKLIFYVAVVILLIVVLFPLYWVFVTSIKSTKDVRGLFVSCSPKPTM